MAEPLKVLVLRGGPDRERPVSMLSGAQVAAALREAGHEVREADITPDDLTALDLFDQWRGDVVFPVLHGKWGEGGPLQRLLEQRGLPFVGCREPAAALCIDKHRTKLALSEQGIDTPAFELIRPDQAPTLKPPVVVKVPDEGSSIGLAICHTQGELDKALAELRTLAPALMIEQFIQGQELTVGVISPDAGSATPIGPIALPPIHIIPATAFYGYEAKYDRDDTHYRFDLPGPADMADRLRAIAQKAFEVLGCRHLCRVDFMLDREGRPWCLEVNTMPGFTTHSLLPMAARQAGLPLPQLTTRLARLGTAER
jgi:D-alanine-D-alanine ligase